MSAPPAPVVVRPARPDELAAAGEVVASAYLHDVEISATYQAHLRDAASRSGPALVLVAVGADDGGSDGGSDGGGDGEVLGTVTWAAGGSPLAQRAGPGEVELRMLGVAPSARGRGIGEALVLDSLERARSAGAHRVVLSTQPQMRAAHRLYERLGFVRAPDLDWTPEAGVELLGYCLALSARR